jgi:hypothetical protein
MIEAPVISVFLSSVSSRILPLYLFFFVSFVYSFLLIIQSFAIFFPSTSSINFSFLFVCLFILFVVAFSSSYAFRLF